MTIFDKETGTRKTEIFDQFGRNLKSRSALRLIAIAIGTILVIWFVGSFLFSATRIEAGYTGIEVNLAGSQRGASQIPIRTGWVIYSPLTTRVIEFPTFVQTVKWTRDTSEGHPLNEYFTHGILRDIVRNSLNEVASTYNVEDIYGEKRRSSYTRLNSRFRRKLATSA